MIKGNEKWSSDVAGLTVLGDELFVVRQLTKDRIEVYSATNFTFQRYIHVDELGTVLGLTSCGTNNCLYVSDCENDCIHRVELTGNNKVTKWKVYGKRWSLCGLSVNSQNNLLVATEDKLKEYTTRGELVREISLRDDVCATDAIQLSSDRFIISHNNDEGTSGVIIVDADGQVLRRSRTGLLDEPNAVAIDRKNGLIYVADTDNDRIVALDCESLNCYREFSVSDRRPESLCFDEQRNQLIVGECNNAKSQIIVCKL